MHKGIGFAWLRNLPGVSEPQTAELGFESACPGTAIHAAPSCLSRQTPPGWASVRRAHTVPRNGCAGSNTIEPGQQPPHLDQGGDDRVTHWSPGFLPPEPPTSRGVLLPRLLPRALRLGRSPSTSQLSEPSPSADRPESLSTPARLARLPQRLTLSQAICHRGPNLSVSCFKLCEAAGEHPHDMGRNGGRSQDTWIVPRTCYSVTVASGSNSLSLSCLLNKMGILGHQVISTFFQCNVSGSSSQTLGQGLPRLRYVNSSLPKLAGKPNE